MSVTPKKLTANRANAKKSTGPRTAAGKKRCSKNATTHGIFCNDLVLPGEDAKLFESFRHAVLLKLSPQDIVELMIVDRIVIAQWKLRRLNAVEASAHVGIAQDRIKGAREELNHERVEKFGTDEPDASHQMQQQLLDAEEKDPDVINHLAVSFIRDEPFLERLSRYEQRLELSIHRNLRQLEKLRKQTQRDRANNTEPSHRRCPYLPGDEYETARQLIADDERNRQNEATEPTDNADDTDHAEPKTQNEAKRSTTNPKSTGMRETESRYQGAGSFESGCAGEGSRIIRRADGDGRSEQVT